MRFSKTYLMACWLFAIGCSGTSVLGDGHQSQDLTNDNKCQTENPAGCTQTGCAAGYVCDRDAGSRPSACNCDEVTGSWNCTADLNGGECVKSQEQVACPAENPAGCSQTGCAAGFTCDTSQNPGPSGCSCDSSTGEWNCTPDLSGGGKCVSSASETACQGDNPAGCGQTGCPEGFTCDEARGGRPSGCSCDESTGDWSCTADLMGGECVAN